MNRIGVSGARPARGKTDKADVRRRVALLTLTFAEELDRFEQDERAAAMSRLVNERAHLARDRAGWIHRLKDRLVISLPEFATALSKPGLFMRKREIDGWGRC